MARPTGHEDLGKASILGVIFGGVPIDFHDRRIRVVIHFRPSVDWHFVEITCLGAWGCAQ